MVQLISFFQKKYEKAAKSQTPNRKYGEQPSLLAVC